MLNEKQFYIVELQIAFLISAQVALLQKVALMFVKYLGFSSIKVKVIEERIKTGQWITCTGNTSLGYIK